MKLYAYNKTEKLVKELISPCEGYQFQRLVNWGDVFTLEYRDWDGMKVKIFNFDPTTLPESAYRHFKSLWFYMLGMQVPNGIRDWTITKIDESNKTLTLEGESFTEKFLDKWFDTPRSELEKLELEEVEFRGPYQFRTIRGWPEGNWVGKTLREFKRAQRALGKLDLERP